MLVNFRNNKKKKYTLELLENKLVNNLDYQFWDSIKSKFPTNNAYFLACLVETIYNNEDGSTEDVVDNIISKAFELYNKSDMLMYLGEL